VACCRGHHTHDHAELPEEGVVRRNTTEARLSDRTEFHHVSHGNEITRTRRNTAPKQELEPNSSIGKGGHNQVENTTPVQFCSCLVGIPIEFCNKIEMLQFFSLTGFNTDNANEHMVLMGWVPVRTLAGTSNHELRTTKW
jgi:hypothetical protein